MLFLDSYVECSRNEGEQYSFASRLALIQCRVQAQQFKSSPFVYTLNTFVQNGAERPIFGGPLLRKSSSRFQLNAPFLQNTGFENAAIFISVGVVLRPYAITRAVTACTCADIIQPCYDRILREICESQTSVILVPDLALADRAIYRGAY